MANLLSLNTADHATLTQVLVALDDGTVFDYKAQQAGGNVTVTDAKKKALLKSVKNPTNGKPWLNET